METSAKEKYLAYVGSQAGYDSYNRFKGFLYGEEDSLVAKLYQDVLKPMLQKHAGDTFSLCDIGGGDGRRLVSLLQKARADFPRIRFEVDFVEPSPAGFGMAEGAIARVQGIATVKAQRATLEKAKLRPANYDLVLLIHSIFTFSSDESIRRILSLKKPTGMVLVVANKPVSFMARVNAKLHEAYAQKRYELTNFLADLERLHIAARSEEKVTSFKVKVGDFEKFAEAVLTWASMGEFRYFNKKDTQVHLNHLKKLATTVDNKYYHYEEVEVFVAL